MSIRRSRKQTMANRTQGWVRENWVSYFLVVHASNATIASCAQRGLESSADPEFSTAINHAFLFVIHTFPSQPAKNIMFELGDDRPSQEPRKRNCMSSGVNFSMDVLSLLMVPLIMFAFFSCNMTMRDSTESSMQRRVMTQGRFCPIRWQRSADCHSAAGFHHLFQESA